VVQWFAWNMHTACGNDLSFCLTPLNEARNSSNFCNPSSPATRDAAMRQGAASAKTATVARFVHCPRRTASFRQHFLAMACVTSARGFIGISMISFSKMSLSRSAKTSRVGVTPSRLQLYQTLPPGRFSVNTQESDDVCQSNDRELLAIRRSEGELDTSFQLYVAEANATVLDNLSDQPLCRAELRYDSSECLASPPWEGLELDWVLIDFQLTLGRVAH
jgi:hypothetical protein